jgi:hypothetical protein
MAELVRYYEQTDQRVALLGECQQFSTTSRIAHVAISSLPPSPKPDPTVDGYLLSGNRMELAALWRIAFREPSRAWRQAAYTVIPNLICVAGAFALGFTSLHAVLLTNLGTFTAYRSAKSWIDGSQWKSTRNIPKGGRSATAHNRSTCKT